VIESDACLRGGAAILRGPGGVLDWCYIDWRRDAGGTFADLSINYKEVAAPLLAIVRWRDRLAGHRVTIHCDNQSACHIVNKGASKSQPVLLPAANCCFALPGCWNERAGLSRCWRLSNFCRRRFSGA
jgi:hypothetical protein